MMGGQRAAGSAARFVREAKRAGWPFAIAPPEETIALSDIKQKAIIIQQSLGYD
jgi:hypothetical protein